MPTQNSIAPKKEYDPRWFIWTIVFLMISGISLVSYIVLSDTDDASAVYQAPKAVLQRK
ncbi:MAG: hypothetical protein NTX98_03060 [Candidatus Doudnabacteria bacterium]|nr:hypothetical protein [Candidatus Doudnabacteria bacterium]